MESILEKILLSAIMCEATGGDPEVEAKKCAEEIAKEVLSEECEASACGKDQSKKTPMNRIASIIASLPMCLRIEHKAGADRAEIEVSGHSAAIAAGIKRLVMEVSLTLHDYEKQKAVEFIKNMCSEIVDALSTGGV